MERVDGVRQSWRCPVCAGFAVTSAVALEALGRTEFNRVWQGLRAGGLSARSCPTCVDRMTQVLVDGVTLDGCVDCQLVWFDAEEWSALLARSTDGRDVLRPLSPEEERAALEKFRRRARSRRDTDRSPDASFSPAADPAEVAIPTLAELLRRMFD